jgi:choline kinase
MKGIVLAAGRGSRLGPATAATPKPLMQVGGRRCIDFALDALLAVVDEVVVVTGHMADQVEAHLAAHWSDKPVTSVRNLDLEAGNLTSLRAARGAIGDGAFVVTNADHLFPADMYTAFFRSGAGVSIACERNRAILDDEMKIVAQDSDLQQISKTLPVFDGAYIGTTSVGGAASAAYWAAFDRVAASMPLASASVEMVLAELARDPATAPQVCWIEGLRWFEVDTEEDLALARAGLDA